MHIICRTIVSLYAVFPDYPPVCSSRRLLIISLDRLSCLGQTLSLLLLPVTSPGLDLRYVQSPPLLRILGVGDFPRSCGHVLASISTCPDMPTYRTLTYQSLGSSEVVFQVCLHRCYRWLSFSLVWESFVLGCGQSASSSPGTRLWRPEERLSRWLYQWSSRKSRRPYQGFLYSLRRKSSET